MASSNTESGFTIVEMIVSMIVMSIFLTLFLQTFLTSESQRKVVIQQATVEDLATANLNKVSSKTGLHAKCNGFSNVAGNSSIANMNSSSDGAIIATDSPAAGSLDPKWSNDTGGRPNSGIPKETTAGKGLPSGIVQELRALFPRGCTTDTPVTIVSIVKYDTENGTETARRAIVIN